MALANSQMREAFLVGVLPLEGTSRKANRVEKGKTSTSICHTGQKHVNRTISKTKQGNLYRLKARTKKFVAKSVSDGTLRSYRQKYKNFKMFAKMLGLPHSPAPTDLISCYVSHLGEKGLQISTIRGYLAAIAFRQKKYIPGHEKLTPYIKQLLKGIQKSKISARAAKRKPITINLLEKILGTLKHSLPHFQSIAMRAIICLQYHACLRAGEIVLSKTAQHTLRRRQIKVRKSKITISFKSYKHMDQAGDKLLVRKNRSNERTCPVKMVRKYMNIRPMTKDNCSFFVKENGRPFKREEVAAALKDAIGRLGLKPKHYNTHSLRSGHATQLFLNQCPNEVIKRYGRWHSEAYLKYIKTNKLYIPGKFKS